MHSDCSSALGKLFRVLTQRGAELVASGILQWKLSIASRELVCSGHRGGHAVSHG